MEIPYYEKDAGIKTWEPPQEGYYVILDKDKVDQITPNLWETFEAVKVECEEELSQFLDFGEVNLSLSPDGDGTYVLNFIDKPLPDNGGRLQ